MAENKDEKSNRVGGLFSLVFLCAVVWGSYEVFLSETDEERAVRSAQEQTEKREDRRKGFHCLSEWDGAHPKLKREVASQMRDPDSFEHESTRITPVSNQGTHRLFMRFRAANGFGGINMVEAVAEIQNNGCGFTILEINELN